MSATTLRIALVVGARPQFIKAAPLTLAAIGSNESVTVSLIHTGQHYDSTMSDVFWDDLGLPAPAHHLGVGSASHGVQTGQMLERLDAVFQAQRPDWCVVVGDTNSTLAGTLAASKLGIPVAHVEAGLRSGDRLMPEEQNRIVADHLGDVLFTPTDGATVNLKREGISALRVVQSGDVMFDSTLLYSDLARRKSRIVDRLGLHPSKFVLATVHRAASTDDRDTLASIIAALSHVAARMPVVFPVHPRTRDRMTRFGLSVDSVEGLRLVPPLGYLDMLMLERAACLIVTDSGGVQKEAFFMRRPCVVLRAETEWTELVELGWCRLARPSSCRSIVDVVDEALARPDGRSATPYGDGHAAKRVIETLLRRRPTAAPGG